MPPASLAADAGNAVMGVITSIDASLRSSRYSHATRVNVAQGLYDFDCSGLAAWVLARAAPRAHRAVLARAGGERPLARDYYHAMAAARAPSRGWAPVARVADARPGDVIAWLKPAIVRSANTGHVAFVVGAPEPLEGVPGGFLLRIADASSYQHENDSRAGTGRTGFGFGTILVVADEVTGAPRAYGWFGRDSAWVLETSIAIGRPQG
ncbi:MAG TPA: hypothetical protein VFS43_09170 [Polyangiaceae bacterium]|nr:hypothetical protein [Polyangiaceae bacterium]